MRGGRPTLLQNLRALPAPAWVLFAGTFVNRFGTFVMPFLVLYFIRSGYSDLQAGLAVGVYGMGLTGIGFALTGLAHTIPALAATVVIWTVGEMVASPVTGAYVSHLAPEHLRGRYHGLWVLMYSIGMVIGPIVGTWVFEHNPTALWAGCGILGIASAGLVMVSARAGARGHRFESGG